MPLFQPSNITPSSFAGVGGGTVAIADKVKITWQVNGNTPMTAYKIDIFDTDNKIVYSSDILTNDTPFYPTDNKGNPKYFAYKPNSTWASCGLTDGNEYILQITQYWGGSTDSSHSVTQFSQSSFITRTTPNLTIKTASGSTDFSTIGSVFQEFIADYTQAQSDSIDWVRWKLFENDVLVDDTGTINTQVLSYVADNMKSGNNYKILCTIQTENGVQITKESEFSVSYQLSQIEGSFELNCLDKASNLLRWSEIAKNTGDDIQGISNDNNYSFQNGSLVLPQGSNLTWDTKNGERLNIPANWSFAWKGSSNGLKNDSGLEKMNCRWFEKEVEHIENNASLKNYATVCRYDKVHDRFLLAGDGYFDNVSPRFISITNDGEITQKAFSSFGFSSDDLKDFDIHNSGEYLIVCGSGSTETTGVIGAKIYKIENETLTFKSTLPSYTTSDLVKDAIIKVKFSQNGKYLCIASSTTKRAYLYGFNNGIANYIANFYIGENVYSLSFNYNSSFLAVGAVSSLYILSVSDTALTQYAKISLTYSTAKFHPQNNNILVAKTTVYRVENNQITPISGKMGGAFFDFNEQGTELYTEETTSSSTLRTTTIRTYIFDNQSYSPIYIDSKTFETDYFGSYNSNHSYNWIAVGKNKILFYGNCIINKRYLYSYNGSLPIDSTIYNATVLTSNIRETGEIEISFSGKSYTVRAAMDYGVHLGATIQFSYLKGNSIPLNEHYMTIGGVSIIRTNNVLTIDASSLSSNKTLAEFEIPKNIIGDILVSVNNEKVRVVFNGVISEKSISNYTQNAITSVVLSGEQTCDYLYVASGTSNFPNDFTPSWGDTTQFMTHFGLGTLQAGQLEVAENSMDIYRENVSTGGFEKLYSCGEQTTEIRDFSWIVGSKYNYYGYARLDDKYTSANLFNKSAVCRNQAYYLLLATTQDEEQPNVYHVVHYWRLGNNIEAGSVSNNNTPNFLNNFTGYRLKQPTAKKGKSGTLTALLSNVANGEYKDTTLQMENLYALSECNNPLFLKDMKGNLYMVTVSGAITQTINTKSAYQEVKVSIPWEEIGSADGISIIQLPTDEGWVDDNAQLGEVRLEVDEETGMLKVVYPDEYNYATTFGLVRPDLYARTTDGVEEADLKLIDGAVILNDED